MDSFKQRYLYLGVKLNVFFALFVRSGTKCLGEKGLSQYLIVSSSIFVFISKNDSFSWTFKIFSESVIFLFYFLFIFFFINYKIEAQLWLPSWLGL